MGNAKEWCWTPAQDGIDPFNWWSLCALCALCALCMAGTFNLDCQLVTKERQENVHYQIAKVGHFYAGNSKRKGEREREREKGGRERKGGEGGGERICGSILGGGVSGEGAAFDPPSKCARNEGKQRPQMSIFRDSKWRRAFSSVANQLT